MLSLSAFWLQGLQIVIVPQPFFTPSNVNLHDNKFCLVATVFLGKATAFLSPRQEGNTQTEVSPDCKQVVQKVTGEVVEFSP